MPWNLLILPLVGGYFILTKCYLFKFHQQRLDRQRLIFESVLLGILLIILTYLIRLIIALICPNLIKSIKAISPFDQQFALTSLASVGIAVILTISFNYFSNDRTWIRKAINDVGNEFESLMKYSFDEKSLLQFTLSNDKVYIAWVKELPIPSISPYVRIIPAISGYRNDKKMVEFTTHYLSVYSSYIEEGIVRYVDDLNTDLILDISDITTVSNFDPKMYKKFQELDPNT